MLTKNYPYLNLSTLFFKTKFAPIVANFSVQVSTLFLMLVFAITFTPIYSEAKPLATCTLVFKTTKLHNTAHISETPAILDTLTHQSYKAHSQTLTLKQVPIVRTETEMNIGLSQRKNVQNGMWFSWPNAEQRIFWMKDTWVDLSVGFFSADGILFEIKHMRSNSLQYQYSSKSAKSALELADGQFEKLGLQVGSQLIKQQCQ